MREVKKRYEIKFRNGYYQAYKHYQYGLRVMTCPEFETEIEAELWLEDYLKQRKNK